MHLPAFPLISRMMKTDEKTHAPVARIPDADVPGTIDRMRKGERRAIASVITELERLSAAAPALPSSTVVPKNFVKVIGPAQYERRVSTYTMQEQKTLARPAATVRPTKAGWLNHQAMAPILKKPPKAMTSRLSHDLRQPRKARQARKGWPR